VQELFYRSVQISRLTKDSSSCVGTCAIYRRAALDANGGITLTEQSENVHTGFEPHGFGWHLRYIPVALSVMVCTDSVGAFQNQKYRGRLTAPQRPCPPLIQRRVPLLVPSMRSVMPNE
jgi:cellulose synthase (UDP-forming)